MTTPEPPTTVRDVAAAFVRDEAGFAQVITLGPTGNPVGRTASAFLNPDWTVDLVQRRGHRRVDQLRRDPRVLISWAGPPAAGSTNEAPAVFDHGLLIPRVVFLQGTAEPMDPEQTWQAYRRHHGALRERGHTRAPDRDRPAVDAELAGLLVRPRRVRLEGFGSGATAFAWTAAASTPERTTHSPH